MVAKKEGLSQDERMLLVASFFYLASTMMVNPLIAGFTGHVWSERELLWGLSRASWGFARSLSGPLPATWLICLPSVTWQRPEPLL